MTRGTRLLLLPVAAAAVITMTQTAYLLTLCGAARARARRRCPPPEGDLLIVALVPAHDERGMIGGAVGSLLACDYEPSRREVVVIADNCTDDTAALARAAGATVWERDDADRPGKGQAVAWGLARLERERPQVEAVVMMDADCTADLGVLAALAAPLRAGADAVQGAYLASNPDASTTAALRFAGYALMNLVRPAGKEALGLSCGLLGSGMAFTARTLATVPWSAFSVTEDKEQHLRLLERGLRVRFAAEAIVRSPMPVSQARGDTQQVRWETGNVELARRWVPRLLRPGVRDGDVPALHAAWELVVPPLSLIAAPIPFVAILGRLGGSRRLMWSSSLTAVGLLAYVLAGLRLAQAPASVFRALLAAPGLVVRRVVQYGALARGEGHREWRRTGRE